MVTQSKRSLEVDFLRGLALLAIALDHIPESLISRFTLHSYALCDAAEVFVFLGGYASAAAFVAVDSRRGAAAARARFFKRSWEIYRAFLITALLMVCLGWLLQRLGAATPAVSDTDAVTFARRPFDFILDVLIFRRQPYLAAVLPMYAMYALCAPLVVPQIQRRVGLVLTASVAMWLVAPVLGGFLPGVYPEGWSFNPFAWQLMFVLGAVCRLKPATLAFQTSRAGRALTGLALLAASGFAIAVLFVQIAPLPGFEKQNLSVWRVANFLAVMWVMAQCVRLGWVMRVARWLPYVTAVGRQGIPCFVAGAVVSLLADAALTQLGHANWALRLGVDALSIASIVVVAYAANRWKSRPRTDSRPTPAAVGAGAGVRSTGGAARLGVTRAVRHTADVDRAPRR
ncbi:MAG: OpgC domain-containing protein [Janthinobacterium lividum]